MNVGGSGAAFEVADGDELRLIDRLLATNRLYSGGLLYDSGDVSIDDDEKLLCTLAENVYRAINEQGDR